MAFDEGCNRHQLSLQSTRGIFSRDGIEATQEGGKTPKDVPKLMICNVFFLEGCPVPLRFHGSGLPPSCRRRQEVACEKGTLFRDGISLPVSFQQRHFCLQKFRERARRAPGCAVKRRGIHRYGLGSAEDITEGERGTRQNRKDFCENQYQSERYRNDYCRASTKFCCLLDQFSKRDALGSSGIE